MSLNQLTDISHKKDWLNIRANNIHLDGLLTNSAGHEFGYSNTTGTIVWSGAITGKESTYKAVQIGQFVSLTIEPFATVATTAAGIMVGTGLPAFLHPDGSSKVAISYVKILEASLPIQGELKIKTNGDIEIYVIDTSTGVCLARNFAHPSANCGIQEPINITYNLNQ